MQEDKAGTQFTGMTGMNVDSVTTMGGVETGRGLRIVTIDSGRYIMSYSEIMEHLNAADPSSAREIWESAEEYR